MWQEFPAEGDARLARRLKPQPEFLPLGYVGDPAAYLEEDSLSDYLKKAPEYDARRIEAFFAPTRTAREKAATTAPPANIDPKARAVLDRYIQAVGGSERLKPVQSQGRRGQLLDNNRKTPFYGVWSAEGKWALSLEQGPGVLEQFGFNGSFGWHAERGDVGQLPEPLVAGISMALDPQLAFKLAGFFGRLAVAQEEPAGERRVTVLEGETIGGARARLTFDSATGLLLSFNHTVFEDYRDVEGVKYPFAIAIRPGTKARFDRMENNVSLAGVDFEPPK